LFLSSFRPPSFLRISIIFPFFSMLASFLIIPSSCYCPCLLSTLGGGLEYPHPSCASPKRRRKGNPMPGGITGPPCSWGYKYGDLALQVGGVSNETVKYRVGQTQLGSFWSLITNQSNNTQENGKVHFVVDRWQLPSMWYVKKAKSTFVRIVSKFWGLCPQFV
jgi:hypothetical protein